MASLIFRPYIPLTGFEPSHHLARRTFDDFCLARGIIDVTPTLAVAFELRTANLIAMLDTSNDRAEVREQLGLQKGDEP
jgi:hypothetical protein